LSDKICRTNPDKKPIVISAARDEQRISSLDYFGQASVLFSQQTIVSQHIFIHKGHRAYRHVIINDYSP
jgi:hypothetical protein